MPYKNPVKQDEFRRAWNKDRNLELRVLIESAKDVPCMDCRKSYPSYVMDFDHRNPSEKLFKLGSPGARAIETIRAEIVKCDVVCSNCHRIRTHKVAPNVMLA